MDRILLDAGSGGKASHRLIHDLFFRLLGNDYLTRMDDAALLPVSGPVAVSTDGFTVSPLFFPGGDIGALAVHGTVNDVAMLGARPRFLTAAFVIEEGFLMADLERIVTSMAKAAKEAGVLVVAGDTKVVPKGAADGMFITTTGIGEVLVQPAPSGHRAKPGDAVLVSGFLGDHGLAIMASREGLSFDVPVVSDCASLNGLVEAVLAAVPEVHVLRDPTRGGLITTLNEIAAQSGVEIQVEEAAVPVRPEVASGCSFLGLDPLYLANEGKLVCLVPEAHGDAALAALRAHPLGRHAARIGTAAAGPSRVVITTPLGGQRLADMLEGEQLPRIC
ncbi:hydrogenase expression/formation protein HypE [Thermodesulfomicrobium sp. WS]|uniref:hydrogenase expression/formation protein HypE n=1 Tax=Thermodesulfomicrobium sp. WS TaxID=3004129 RepID=UPI0024921D71|nr:hydrogenase expression/formation protein HypE [Thermodesulfomicrobium sp. WS]BDV01603.1 hydrogenase expression/formation protein HypE [Thermodesulfomicrobium sp. WS]